MIPLFITTSIPALSNHGVPIMRLISFRKSIVTSFLVGISLGILSLIFSTQTAQAGSVGFGSDTGSGFGTVSIPYDAKLDVSDGAFNLEMWVKEISRTPLGGQYTASFWSSNVQHYYHERNTLTSSFMWGLSFDGPNFFAAWRANQNYFYPAGSDMGYADALTSNTKTAAQVYNTFADAEWHHIALSKTGVNGALSMYLDGVRVLYVPVDDKTYSLLGGDVILGGLKFVGQIGDVRLVKGQALYTGPSITVPTSQITTTSQGALSSNVSLLLKASGTLCAVEDVSDNHFSVVLNGATCSNATTGLITTYNVQFDKQGHGTQPSDSQVTISNSIPFANLPAESTDGDFNFLGWSETPTGAVLTDAYTPTADSTLYAIWQDTRPKYTVTYNLNYPSAPAAPTQIDLLEAATFTVAANPSRAGFLFTGWTDGGNVAYGGPSYKNATYTVGTSNITLTAQWESTAHPIVRTFQNNYPNPNNWISGYFGSGVHTGIDIVPGWCAISGDGVDPTTWIVTALNPTSDWEQIQAGPLSTRFTFGGFYGFSPDTAITFTTGATQVVNQNNAITSTVTSNSRCGANKYTISPALPSGVTLDSETGVISGTPETAQAATSYTLTAERWVDSAGGLDITGTKIGYSTATFSLQVIPTHTVTYAVGAHGTGNLPTSPEVAEGSTFIVAAGSGLTHDSGYHFVKWNNGTTDFSPTDQYTMSTSNVTLTAQWAIDTFAFAITFDPGTGTGSQSALIGTDSSLTLSLLNTGSIAKSGYHFIGWLDEGSTTYSDGQHISLSSTFTHTLTAQWAINTYAYAITFKAGTGTGALGAQSGNSSSVTLSLLNTGTMAKSGYHFLNWLGNDSLTYTNGQTIPITAGFTRTLTAQWEKNPPVAQAALLVSNSSTTFLLGATTKMTSSGGSGTGAVTFSVIGVGCSLNGTALTAAMVTTCTVTATKAASNGYLVATSAPKNFYFVMPMPLPTISNVLRVPLSLTFYITNYNPAFNYNVTSSVGTVVIGDAVGSKLLITVKATNASTLNKYRITITASQTGYATNSALLIK